MSHEGIRIVSQEQAEAETAHSQLSQEPLSDDALSPLKVRVKKTEGTGVEIEWRDGHQSAWNFAWLRHACPCATCQEDRDKTGREIGAAPAKPKTLLVMYEPPVRPVEVTPVGKYALKFKWTDGHESGIYSWEYLRRVCRCDACMTRLGLNG